MKEHNLIEKTAAFIASHGAQMEIVIKAKQANNANLKFMDVGSPLFPYYKHLLNAIKSGSYSPNAKQEDAEDSESNSDSDDDGHYLHPSLMGSKPKPSPATTVVTMPMPINEANPYKQIVTSLIGKIPQPEKAPEKSEPEVKPAASEPTQRAQDQPKQSKWSILPPPPPELEVIIDKLAVYVAKNGDEFEKQVKKRNDERFSFLNPGDVHHAHYIRRKVHYIEEERKKFIAAKSEDDKNKRAVAFSLPKREKKTVHSDDELEWTSERSSKSCDDRSSTNNDALANRLAAAAKEEVSREKKLQEERKRRTQLFLSLLKSKQQSDANNDQPVIGPSLPNIQPLPVVERPPASAEKPEVKPEVTVSNKTAAHIPFIRPDKRHSDDYDRHRHYKKSRSSDSRR